MPTPYCTAERLAKPALARRTLLHGLWLLLVLWMVLPARAAGADLIVERGFWEDSAAAATWAEARTQTFTPFEGSFNRGFSASTHWIRLRLSASPAPIGLRLTPPWVDEITLYDDAQTGSPQRGGDHHPLGTTANPVLGYSFVLPASDSPRDIWLQLRSTSAHQLHFQAMPADELAADETRAIVWTSLYAAVLLLMLLALLSAWWVQKEVVLGIYLLRHATFMLYATGYLGLPLLLLHNSLPAGSLHAMFSLAVCTTLPVGLWFDIALLKTYAPRPWLLRLAQGLCALSLALPLLWLMGHERLALQSTVTSFVPAALLVFAMAVTVRPAASVEQLMPKRVMLVYYAIVLSSLLIGLFGLLGLNNSLVWSQYLLILHGLVSGLLMTTILFVRGQRQYSQHQQMSWQLQKAQQEVELEQRRRHEQSQFLHMLMHELKTPLSIVSLALGTRRNREENLQHASRAVQDMKAIIDRCVEADQLGQMSLQPQADGVDLKDLLQSLAERIPRLDLRLQLQGPEHMPMLRTDRQLLEIILTNLLDNASRYSDPLTPVTVQVFANRHKGRDGLEVTIRNTPGLAGWPDADQLFGKYYRASGAQSGSGSGLGLYLSRQLAQTLGGTMQYAPTDRFVEFKLWIPMSLT